MGWDICTFGKHRLDTSSVGGVARELADKLDINIKYGYYKKYLFDKKKKTLTENEKSFDFVNVGRIRKNDLDYYYQLTDEYYQYKNIRSEIDEDDITKYKWRKKDFKYGNNKQYFLKEYYNALDKENYSLNLCDRKYRKRKESILLGGINIYNEVIDINYDFPWRWFGFAQAFTKANVWDENFGITNRIRRDLKKYYNALGCQEIIFHPDQGPAQLICGKYEQSWKDIFSYVKKKAYYEDLLKSEFVDEETRRLYQNDYSQKDMQLQLNIPNFFKKKQKFFPAYTEIEIFFDDFSDID